MAALRDYLRIIVAAASLFSLGERAAWARHDLKPFSPEVLRRYAAVLGRSEIGVVESDPQGHAHQITLLGYAAAPPTITYRLVADPTLYPRYVRNMTRSDVERKPDGTVHQHWKLSYPIGSFEGTDEVRLVPGNPGSVIGAVEVRTLGQGKEGISHWEFFAHPETGGTLIVVYGYYDPLDNGFLRMIIGNNPALDAGFNLAGVLSLLRSLIREANREAQQSGVAPAVTPIATAAPDLSPLLNRGTVAIVRSDKDGRLVDVSVVERMPVPLPQLLALVRDPELMPKAIRSVKKVVVSERDTTGIEYDVTVDGLITDVETTFRMLFVQNGADNLAISGAAKGARFRWDIRPDVQGPNTSTVVWRGSLHLADTSRIMKTMLNIEPSFEHSANITVGLMSVRSLAAQFAPAAAAAVAPAQQAPR